MKFYTNSNIIPLFENVTKAILPFAASNGITVHFHAPSQEFDFLYYPTDIIKEYCDLLCKIIVFTPQNYALNISLSGNVDGESNLKVTIKNTGANLERIQEITTGLSYEYKVCSSEPDSTIFEIMVPNKSSDLFQKEKHSKINHHGIPPYYTEIRKRLKSHFSSIESIENTVLKKSDVQGVFIKKVNALLEANLDNEAFKTESLCQGLALSRTQLYRKLKNLANMSPARYIQYYRLQRAKELLQNTTLNVSEVVARVGFISHSHFTRCFTNQFGINPSLMK
jgi:AraC-like DNA-binding protein